MLSIDFETGSRADLRKVGAAKYAEDPTTRIICVAYNQPWIDGKQDEVKSVYIPPGERWSPEPGLKNWINRGRPVRAWNAAFEYYIWFNHVLGSCCLKAEQLHDTMAQAAYWGLPLSLDMAGQALPELGIVKDKEGQALMKRMSRPRKVEADGTVHWWDVDDPEKRQALMDYCEQDVRVESSIAEYLPPLPDKERRIWLMDFRANSRGIALDKKLANRMKDLAAREQSRLDKELGDATGGAVQNTTKAVALAEWCVNEGLDAAKGGLAKDRLPGLIRKAYDKGLVRVGDALELRQEAAKSSVAKLDAMLNYCCADGRMRGLTQYYGAFRTGRWAGRGPQVQNFPRSEVKDQELLVNTLLGDHTTEPQMLELMFGVRPLTALSSALRGCLYVPEHEGTFAALDFSQIEARVLAWLAGSEKILEAYRQGMDLYKIAADDIYGCGYANVDSDQRQIGKVSTLALGYQGGVGAFQTMAKVYGLELADDKADEIKTAWRAKNKEITSYWYAVQDAALEAVRTPGAVANVERNGVRVLFSYWKNRHLLVKLPSGRTLCYRDAEIGQGTYGDVVTYMGVDQYTRQWTRVETYGGKLVENITQAVARDVMADGLLALDELDGVRILGSVHDEALLWLEPGARSNSARVMCIAGDNWAKGLPIEADGYVGRRFRK